MEAPSNAKCFVDLIIVGITDTYCQVLVIDQGNFLKILSITAWITSIVSTQEADGVHFSLGYTTGLIDSTNSTPSANETYM